MREARQAHMRAKSNKHAVYLVYRLLVRDEPVCRHRVDADLPQQRSTWHAVSIESIKMELSHMFACHQHRVPAPVSLRETIEFRCVRRGGGGLRARLLNLGPSQTLAVAAR